MASTDTLCKLQRFGIKWLLTFIVSFFLGSTAIAGSSQGITYTGRIVRPDGLAANSGSITFTLKVMDASNNCRLWSETQTVNMTDTSGTFALVVGAGTRTDAGTQTLKQVFTNAGTLSGLTCTTGTTYSPGASDDRNLVVSFDDAGTAVTLSTVAIKSVPFALQADQVSGYGIMNLAKISGLGTSTTMTGTQFDFLTNLAAPASATATPCAANDTLKYVGGVWTCAAGGGGGSSSTSGLTAATATNTIDNTNYAQTWNWSTATTQSPMSIAANSITTGSLMNLTTSSAAVNSTSGLLNVANTSATTTGVLARFQSNSTAGSGLTVLANGNVGIGTTAPGAQLQVNSTSTNNSTNARGMITNLTYSPSANNSSSGFAISANMTYSPSATANINGGLMGANFSASTTSGDLSLINLIVGNNSSVTHVSSGNINSAVGAQSSVDLGGSGSTTDAYGTKSSVVATNSTAINAYGVSGSLQTSAAATSMILTGKAGNFEVVRGAGSTILNAYGVYTGSVQGTNKWSLYASDATAPSYFAGKVGIGTSGPTEALDVAANLKVSGQDYSGAYVVASGANIDFNNGNIQVLQSVGATALNLSNLKNGASYVLIVMDATARTYTFSGCTTAQFNPANGDTTASTTTIYNILSVTIASTQYCFISWGSGYQ
jgi:hypothetical protein